MKKIRKCFITNGRQKRFPVIILFLLELVFLATACKKEISGALPDDKKSSALNFYAATDVMATAYNNQSNKGLVAIYVDEYQQRTDPLLGGESTDYGYPTLYFGNIAHSVTAPQHPITATNNNSINYTWFVSGEHTIYFTDIINTPVMETHAGLIPGSFNTLYLADAPGTNGTEPTYQVLAVQEPRHVPEGKTGIRFIHLSPDAGELTARLEKADGSLETTQAGTLTFGKTTDYQYFDATDAVSGFLRFALEGNNTKLNTATSFGAGRSYVVVIKGFVNPQQRLVATGRDTNGKPVKETISIGSNLRTDVRRSY